MDYKKLATEDQLKKEQKLGNVFVSFRKLCNVSFELLRLLTALTDISDIALFGSGA